MARPVKKALYRNGPVRVTARKDGRLQLLATVDGRQIERSGTRDLDVAKQRADAWAQELALPAPALNAGCYFRDVVVAFLEAPHETWGKKHRARLNGFARNHILPELGKKRARNLDAAACLKLLNGMADDGYSWYTVLGVLTLTRSVVRHGRNTGVWHSSVDPIYGLTMPNPAKFKQSVENLKPGEVLRVDPAEVPTVQQCADLAAGLRLIGEPLYALMVELAAETGLRWGELIGASPEQWDAATRVFTVDRQLVEYDSGPPEWTLPKHGKVRAFVVGEVLAERLTAACEAAREAGRTHEFYDVRTKRDERRVLIFTGPRGGWLRRSNFNRRVLRPAMRDCGWPDTLSWHDLRHRFCISMGELMSWVDVAELAGHHSPDFTLKRYGQSDSDVLERQRQALAAAGR